MEHVSLLSSLYMVKKSQNIRVCYQEGAGVVLVPPHLPNEEETRWWRHLVEEQEWVCFNRNWQHPHWHIQSFTDLNLTIGQRTQGVICLSRHRRVWQARRASPCPLGHHYRSKYATKQRGNKNSPGLQGWCTAHSWDEMNSRQRSRCVQQRGGRLERRRDTTSVSQPQAPLPDNLSALSWNSWGVCQNHTL